MTLPVGVLALQGDFREHRQAMERLGCETRAVRSAEDLSGIGGLILPGGESTTIALLAKRRGMLEPMRAAAAAGMPMYGSCAGMILLAREVLDGRSDQQTLGVLDIVVRRNAFGRQVASFEADIDMPVLGSDPIHAVFIRAPWVESCGESVEALGRVESGPAAGKIVAVRSGSVIATAFHPEVTADARVHELFRDAVESYVPEPPDGVFRKDWA